jgi:hypothetical protein
MSLALLRCMSPEMALSGDPALQHRMTAFGGRADIRLGSPNVCFGPKAVISGSLDSLYFRPAFGH